MLTLRGTKGFVGFFAQPKALKTFRLFFTKKNLLVMLDMSNNITPVLQKSVEGQLLINIIKKGGASFVGKKIKPLLSYATLEFRNLNML